MHLWQQKSTLFLAIIVRRNHRPYDVAQSMKNSYSRNQCNDSCSFNGAPWAVKFQSLKAERHFLKTFYNTIHICCWQLAELIPPKVSPADIVSLNGNEPINKCFLVCALLFCFIFSLLFWSKPCYKMGSAKIDFVTAALLASSYRVAKIQLHKDKNGDAN